MDTKLLKGKCALITGAYRNLGSVTAETLARNGADVVINDIDSPALKDDRKKVLENIRSHDVKALAVEADLSSPGAVKKLCERSLEAMGRIDIIVIIRAIPGSKKYANLVFHSLVGVDTAADADHR